MDQFSQEKSKYIQKKVLLFFPIGNEKLINSDIFVTKRKERRKKEEKRAQLSTREKVATDEFVVESSWHCTSGRKWHYLKKDFRSLKRERIQEEGAKVQLQKSLE